MAERTCRYSISTKPSARITMTRASRPDGASTMVCRSKRGPIAGIFGSRPGSE
jgi:hypothetical protein